jgi:hypothetical protein
LFQEFEPNSRQGNLAIAQTLSNYPVLAGSKSVLEQMLSREQLVRQFEEASSAAYPSEVR